MFDRTRQAQAADFPAISEMTSGAAQKLFFTP
jgi:hypothetical protein